MMPDEEDLYLARKRTTAEPLREGSKEGVATLEVPNVHYALWGQPVFHFARATDFKEADLPYNIEIEFWPSILVDAKSLQSLHRRERHGDSFLKSSDGLAYTLKIEGQEYHLTFVHNPEGRIAGIKIENFKAPNIDAAFGVGRAIAYEFQRAAAVSGVPLSTVRIDATRSDRMEQKGLSNVPYPTVDIWLVTHSPFPAVDRVLSVLAEGRRATSPFYRALCFFKIVEIFIDKIQPALTKAFHAVSLEYTKLDLTLPEDPLKKVAPAVVGMKYRGGPGFLDSRLSDDFAPSKAKEAFRRSIPWHDVLAGTTHRPSRRRWPCSPFGAS